MRGSCEPVKEEKAAVISRRLGVSTEQITRNTKVNSMTTLSNGQVRKSLASQIDRLDIMLDGLADGLNELVVTAVKQAVEVAVKEGVRSVLSEVLANKDLLSKLQGAVTVPAAPSEPTASCDAASPGGVSLAQRLGRVCKWISARMK